MSNEALPAAQTADARQAQLLLDIGLRPLIGQLMEQPCSAAEVARKQNISIQKAHYLLEKLMAAGVVRLDSVQPRAGRAIKRYRMAPRWFVPFRVTGAATLDAFVEAQMLPRMQKFVNLTVQQIEAEYSQWGFWLEREEESSTLRMGDPSGAALALFRGDEPFLMEIGTIWLSREQASRLKFRLLEVMQEFYSLDDLSQTPHTVALLMARGDVG